MVPSACSSTCFFMMKMLQSFELPKRPSIAITLPCCLSGFVSGSVWAWIRRRCTVLSNTCFSFWSPDVNECVTNTHTCQPHERCVNTVGAFMCERQISCSSGYQLRNGVCEGRHSLLLFLFSTRSPIILQNFTCTLCSFVLSSQNWGMERVKIIHFHFFFPHWSNPSKITELIFKELQSLVVILHTIICKWTCTCSF